MVSLDEHASPRCQELDRLPATLGRHPEAGVRLSDSWVSRSHCEIRDRNGTLVVRDLGSKHGTYVNGKKVTTEAPLAPGDRLSVGLTSFLVEWEETNVFSSDTRLVLNATHRADQATVQVPQPWDRRT